MRYIKEEFTNNHGAPKTRYLIALGKEEAEIIHGLLERAYQFLPRTTETQIIGHRIGTMLKCLKEIIKIIKKNENITK
jgi:hypothetical protein